MASKKQIAWRKKFSRAVKVCSKKKTRKARNDCTSKKLKKKSKKRK